MTIESLSSFRAVISGRVQGVFFRAFVKENAIQLGLTGTVRNLPSGNQVEVIAEGEKEKLSTLLELLKTGPAHARVGEVSVIWQEYSKKFSDFSILYE